MTNLCQCGCGAEISHLKRYVSGHNARTGIRKPRFSFTCQHCGKITEVMPHMHYRKFCSASCRDDFRRQRASEHHPQYNRIEHLCTICNKTFLIAPQRIKAGKRYCSKECGNEARRRRLKTLEPNAKGGLSNGTLKSFILDRDGNKCRVCGFSSIVEIHHIIPRKDGGKHRVDNLITLCPNHHQMAHKGMIDLKDYI